jgi:prepilin-type N-terminal cleavage/methylation domain-containing protein
VTESTRGFSLVEVLIATLVMVVVLSAVLGTLSRASDVLSTQPDVADVQQRLRVAIATLQRDLINAGAGGYIGRVPHGLAHYVAPVLPYRWGADPSNAFRDDVITVMSVPASAAQASVAAVRIVGADLDIDLRAGDGAPAFTTGMQVLIVTPAGTWSFGVVTNVSLDSLRVRSMNGLPPAFDAGSATVLEVAIDTYSLKRDASAGTLQLVHYDGVETEMPVVDHVTALGFRYWLEQPGETELADASGATLTDGPWLPAATAPLRYDADLLRIRRIGVRLRVEAAYPWLRRGAPRSRLVQDQEVTFDVSPPNLNLEP